MCERWALAAVGGWDAEAASRIYEQRPFRTQAGPKISGGACLQHPFRCCALQALWAPAAEHQWHNQLVRGMAWRVHGWQQPRRSYCPGPARPLPHAAAAVGDGRADPPQPATLWRRGAERRFSPEGRCGSKLIFPSIEEKMVFSGPPREVLMPYFSSKQEFQNLYPLNAWSQPGGEQDALQVRRHRRYRGQV